MSLLSLDIKIVTFFYTFDETSERQLLKSFTDIKVWRLEINDWFENSQKFEFLAITTLYHFASKRLNSQWGILEENSAMILQF